MDLKEASIMTEASGLVDDHIAGESAGHKPPCGAEPTSRSARPDPDSRPTAGLSDQLREIARAAPLQAVFGAFLLGVLMARRR
ncbi:hypothetical protein ACVWXQ_000685 [Bradyrhizobium sp. S3.14.4]